MHWKILSIVLICIVMNTTFVASAQTETLGPIGCGDIVRGEVQPNQSLSVPNPYFSGEITVDAYSLQISAGTRINLTARPLGNTFNLLIALVDSAGNDVHLENQVASGEAEELISFPLGSSNQILRIIGLQTNYVGIDTNYVYRSSTNSFGAGGGHWFGAYEIRVGCVLEDGTLIEPGETIDPSNTGPSLQPSSVSFIGFGFPGVSSVDFSAGIEIPISSGQTQTVPVGNDIALYTYDASAGAIATLSVSRVSGNISIGVTVINRDTNEIIFFGGLPSSNNLSVELTFPLAGTYAIGLFRLDTAERTGTSGAVQIQIE